MKNLILVLGTLLAAAATHASPDQVELSKRTVVLNVDISPANLRLSGADYTTPVVKVLVPELADVTILDHRNTNEGAPCLATYQTRIPNAVIQDNPAVEQIPFEITLKKMVLPSGDNSKCDVVLIETVHGKIRGFDFVHDRSLSVGQRQIEDCR